MPSEVFKSMAEAAKAAAECALAMSIADGKATKAADAYEAAAKAQEALALDATSYWANAAVFRGIAAQGKAMGFDRLIGDFLYLAEVCES